MGNHKLVEAAKEALAIAKGDQPAAAIWHNGHQYVPEAENASLRQQLAEARETARREALEEAEKLVHDARADLERQSGTTLNSVTHDALLMASDALELVGEEIRALSHPDREGERPSETETAARIVDTQAQYYAGHNEDIAKALREAAGAIRAQSQPRPGREGERE